MALVRAALLRRVCIVAAIAAVFSMLAAARSHRMYYDSSTGALRAVTTYRLVLGPRLRLDLLKTSDATVPTEVSRFLSRGGNGVPVSPTWVFMSEDETGALTGVNVDAPKPHVVVAVLYREFERCYRPLLPEPEYEALLRLALQPEHVKVVNQVFDLDFLRAVSEAADDSQRRRLLRSKLGDLWDSRVAAGARPPTR